MKRSKLEASAATATITLPPPRAGHPPSRHPKKSPSESTIDWKRLHTFLSVAERKSFTSAGRCLNLSQSAVSRQISILEKELQTPLFLRTSQGLVLTEAGDDFFATVRAMANKLSMGVARINEWREKPEGPLRITTSLAFGSGWLTARINTFHQVYPGISLSLLLVDDLELDLLLREADCALRFARQKHPSLIQRMLMKVRYHVFASQEYLDRRGTPRTAHDLDLHDIIVYGDDVPAPITDMNWLLTVDAPPREPRTPTLRVNSVYGIYRAVESGLGIAALPYYVTEEAPDLVEILPELRGPSFEVFFVYPEELKHSKRIQALRDFLVDESRLDKSSGKSDDRANP
ncbi:MAG: LysR family transcriptional regulator [Hyphomicrobiaceae bacterium]|nr:LysR family transcriptional regulator [Hyphomicrobiaceae bacterium]